MIRSLTLMTLFALLAVAGCKTTTDRPPQPWGPAYSDIVAPPNYVQHDNPPFKRTDRADGTRLHGRYAYRSAGEGLDTPSRVLNFLRDSMANDGWTLMVEEHDDRRGTMSARFSKGDDQVVLSLAPDGLVRSSERFSILTVHLNPQY